MKNNKLKIAKYVLVTLFAFMLGLGIANSASMHMEITPMDRLWLVLAITIMSLIVSFRHEFRGVLGAQALNLEDETYAGEAASFLLLRQVQNMDTMEKGCINLIDNIKKKHTIDRLEITNFIQDDAPTPTSQGAVTIDSRVLNPNTFQVYFEFNPRIFEQNWFAVELPAPLLHRPLPATPQSYMMMHLMKELNRYNEFSIWQNRLAYNPISGNEATPAALVNATNANNFYYYDGLIEKALLDANTLTVANAVPLTVANIRTQFKAALHLVPQALLWKYGPQGLRFLVSYQDKLTYSDALREDTFKNENTTEASVDKYAGYEVVALAGLPQGTFFLAIANPNPLSGNAFVGLNSTEDSKVELNFLQNNSSLWFVRALQKMDVNWGFTDQLVMYTALTV